MRTHAERQVEHERVRVEVAVVPAVVPRREERVRDAPRAVRRDRLGRAEGEPAARRVAHLGRHGGVVAGPEPDADALGARARDGVVAAARVVERRAIGRGLLEDDAAALVRVVVRVTDVRRGHAGAEVSPAAQGAREESGDSP